MWSPLDVVSAYAGDMYIVSLLARRPTSATDPHGVSGVLGGPHVRSIIHPYKPDLQLFPSEYPMWNRDEYGASSGCWTTNCVNSGSNDGSTYNTTKGLPREVQESLNQQNEHRNKNRKKKSGRGNPLSYKYVTLVQHQRRN